jgi:hypothetical protein
MSEELYMCKKCEEVKDGEEFYFTHYNGTYRVDLSACKTCRRLKALARRAEILHVGNCKGCDRKFGDDLVPIARGYCSACYKNILREKEGNCSECNVVFGSGGKKTNYTSKGKCLTCYTKWWKSNIKLECVECGDKLPGRGSLKGLCAICKSKKTSNSEQKLIEKGLLKGRRYEYKIDAESIEQIRWLLLRFKYGTYTVVDMYRLAGLFEDLYGVTNRLDSKDPEIQIILMLKKLKEVYEKNKTKFNI